MFWMSIGGLGGEHVSERLEVSPYFHVLPGYMVAISIPEQ